MAGSHYDPHSRQPETLGELEHWMRAAAVSASAAMVPAPVRLDSPPIPGLGRLSAYCQANYGEGLTRETVCRLIGQYALARDVSPDEAKGASLKDAANVLAPSTRKAQTLSTPYHRIAGILHDLYWLAVEARQGAAADIDTINATTESWDAALDEARRTSQSRGIPVNVFDPVLIQARETLNRLAQVAAGNGSVPFHDLDSTFPELERRLRDLGTSYASGETMIKERLATRTVGYNPSTEISCIVIELNNPLSNLPPKPGEPVELLNPFDVERRKWLPLLKDSIGKIPELANGLTEEKLRQWLWREHKTPPTQDLNAQQLMALLDSAKVPKAADRTEPAAEDRAGPPKKKAKRSFEQGEGRAKIIGALATHHKYENGTCQNSQPIVANELARMAKVGKSTVNRFFNREFNKGQKGGYARYRRACITPGLLEEALKLLLGETTPSILFNSLRNANELEDADR
jgi:hypothetical protein